MWVETHKTVAGVCVCVRVSVVWLEVTHVFCEDSEQITASFVTKVWDAPGSWLVYQKTLIKLPV